MSNLPDRLAAALFLVLLPLMAQQQNKAPKQNEIRFTITADPKTFNPLLAIEDNAATVVDLTARSLIRTNRFTQKPEPCLADSWKISPDHKSITFHLRPGISYSDGTPLTADDVAFTVHSAGDPATQSPQADTFPATVRTNVHTPDSVTVTFPTTQVSFEALFDGLPILSSKSPLKEKAALGPFMLAEYRPGIDILFRRNPHYWRKDAAGHALPYLDSVRLLIQQNKEIQVARFRQHEIQLINNLEPATFKRLAKESPAEAIDIGASSDVDFLWFNEMSLPSIPEYKRAWFQSRNFRAAISQAINRDDICRIVYLGYAHPALGPVSPSNQVWFDSKLKPETFDPAAALKLLQQEGFQLKDGELHDKAGHLVEFSLITNSGNKTREGMTVLIQQDLKKIGIQVNLVTLEFRSLIERISKTYNYEAILLGIVNVGIDPNGQMNLWVSSGPQHTWNPNQKTPATQWEAEIDRLMQTQETALEPAKRKAAFDRVQEIIREQRPYIYLVNRDILSAVSTSLKGVQPAKLFPQTFWNIDQISFQ